MLTKDGWKGFASAKSRHLPKNNELVYFGDEMVDDKWNVGIEPATVYRVVTMIFNFNNYNEADDCSAVEITVEKTNIDQ